MIGFNFVNFYVQIFYMVGSNNKLDTQINNSTHFQFFHCKEQIWYIYLKTELNKSYSGSFIINKNKDIKET